MARYPGAMTANRSTRGYPSRKAPSAKASWIKPNPTALPSKPTQRFGWYQFDYRLMEPIPDQECLSGDVTDRRRHGDDEIWLAPDQPPRRRPIRAAAPIQPAACSA